MSSKKHHGHRKTERDKKRKKICCYLSDQQAGLWKKLKQILNTSTDSELLDRLIVDEYRRENGGQFANND